MKLKIRGRLQRGVAFSGRKRNYAGRNGKLDVFSVEYVDMQPTTAVNRLTRRRRIDRCSYRVFVS